MNIHVYTFQFTNNVMESQKSPAQLDEMINLSVGNVRARLLGRFFGGRRGLRQPIARLSIVRDVGTHRLVGSVLLVDQGHQQILYMRLGSFYFFWRDTRQSRHIASINTSNRKSWRKRCPWRCSWSCYLPPIFRQILAQIFVLSILSHHILVLKTGYLVRFLTEQDWL